MVTITKQLRKLEEEKGKLEEERKALTEQVASLTRKLSKVSPLQADSLQFDNQVDTEGERDRAVKEAEKLKTELRQLRELHEAVMTDGEEEGEGEEEEKPSPKERKAKTKPKAKRKAKKSDDDSEGFSGSDDDYDALFGFESAPKSTKGKAEPEKLDKAEQQVG